MHRHAKRVSKVSLLTIKTVRELSKPDYIKCCSTTSFRGADCDTDHYLVVAKLRERLAVSKEEARKSDGERFNLRKLNELEIKKKYQIEITKGFAALDNLNVDEEVNRAWENIKEKIKISVIENLGLHELKQRKPWFDEE